MNQTLIRCCNHKIFSAILGFKGQIHFTGSINQYHQNYNSMKNSFLLFLILIISYSSKSQGSWQLWGSGVTSGAWPRLTVAPNHDIFFVRMSGGSITPGVLYKANTQSVTGTFVAMPAIPVPPSLVNNVYSITTNQNSEPIAGIFRSNIFDPWLFRFNNSTQQWVTAVTNTSPSLGAYTMERAPNGTIWVGAKWTLVYKSTDNGNTYTGIDESTSVTAAYPCYFPTWGGSTLDGAIYGVNIDKNNRVYLGTETAGLLYSDDQGTHWKPVDYHLCKTNFPTQRDSFSPMKPANFGGNCAGIAFNQNNDVVWSGGAMWTFNWPNEIALANMSAHTITPAVGIPNALITSGQQVSKIVTASNGQMFLHSGGASGATGIGIYTSMDGINWQLFNTGITGTNLGQSLGSLAVDGNMVFMATQDGQIWKYTVPTVLPIRLISFLATARGNNNVLTWKTASEDNTKVFEIERARDAMNFEKLGSVTAAGNSTEAKSYQFMDNMPFESLNYYRIKEIDIDGTIKYSNVLNVKKGQKNFLIYPAVTSGPLTVKNDSGNKIDKVQIFSTTGQEYYVQPVIMVNALQFDLSSLPAGIYFINVHCKGESFTERVIKN